VSTEDRSRRTHVAEQGEAKEAQDVTAVEDLEEFTAAPIHTGHPAAHHVPNKVNSICCMSKHTLSNLRHALYSHQRIQPNTRAIVPAKLLIELSVPQSKK
jgi:hypothetical protein